MVKCWRSVLDDPVALVSRLEGLGRGGLHG